MANEVLIASAKEISAKSYAPYSGYHVGAAVLGSDGNVYTGCNFENISFSVSLCAERSAIAKMVSAGCREFTEAAVCTQDSGTPCGACLQVFYEFVTDPSKVKVHCIANSTNEIRTYFLSELLPHGFHTDIVAKQPNA